MTGAIRTTVLAAALAAVPVGAAIAQSGDEADVAAIEEMWDAYEAAVEAGDAETYLGLWDEGGVQMPPGAPARDKSVLVEAIPKRFAGSKVDAMTITPEETVIADDIAFSRGVYTVEAGGEVTMDGKFLTIFRRQDDGSWRIYRDAFNSNAP